ncbi:TetR/AcrR family transcriptional regulator [Arthrobacter sp. M4]|uniref:TetR/AcrR family transcriptional regulator n=1 Tax=Arthrobacter sp. M4 TaxID=218160 RepID=UPI001CDB9337|nr:TetR/AcrR family transcriptional regulator [Arthrobacter sp. M4]MCA4135616.1 TetR/AcrR family transcriptional regulator [Arthrobacter sp. M4]
MLSAARDLVSEVGADAVTMDMLACRAGVGKGTVFRRFGSRSGLMLTLLSDAEAEFQRRFMFGPPPLGPGAPPLDRLIAFGAGRIGYILEFGELARAAVERDYGRFDVPAAVLWNRHLEILLREAGLRLDTGLMAASLAATLDPARLLHSIQKQGVSPERLVESWRQLVTRIVTAPEPDEGLEDIGKR